MPRAHFLVVFLTFVFCRSIDGYEHFDGGSISFSVRNDSGKMFADLDVLTGWVLQRGPCGYNCSEADLGMTTNSRRPAIVAAAGDPDYFGIWTAEYKFNRQTHVKALTLNSNMKEVVLRIDTDAKWEQELMKVSVELEDTNTDVFEDIQIKLNQINKIHVSVVDPENDLVKCTAAQSSEAASSLLDITMSHTLPGVPGLRVYENCTVMIDTNETAHGYYAGKQYSVALTVRDYSKHDIRLGNELHHKYEFSLSAVTVQFVIQIQSYFDGPIFVKPSIDSNHHVILYTGAIWRQKIHAKAGVNRTVAKFIAYGRNQEHLNVIAIHDGSDPKVRYVEVTWNPPGIDTENHIFCITAIDDTGVASDEDMCFTIETQMERFNSTSSLVTNRPHFFNLPDKGQLVECAVDVTCVLPLYIKSAVDIRKVLVSRTSFDETETGPITITTIIGETVYQSDLSFRHFSAGHHEICIYAVDDKGDQLAETCIQTKLDPPDPCKSTPCKNSGTCARSQGDPNDYTCHCLQHFSGKQCENRDLLCPRKPCNHGVCYDIYPYDYYCDCSSTGYEGHNCSLPSSSCQQDGCVHGLCQSFVLSSHCVCDPGYEGQRCETSMGVSVRGV